MFQWSKYFTMKMKQCCWCCESMASSYWARCQIRSKILLGWHAEETNGIYCYSNCISMLIKSIKVFEKFKQLISSLPMAKVILFSKSQCPTTEEVKEMRNSWMFSFSCWRHNIGHQLRSGSVYPIPAKSRTC